MKMKRFVVAVLSVVMSLSLVACGDSSNSSNSSNSSTPVVSASSGERTYEGTFITHTSSSTGGIWYPMATAIDTIWEAELGLVPKLMPGAAEENIKSIADGTTDVAWCQSISLIDAYNGASPFDDGKNYDNVSLIACIHPAAVQAIALADSEVDDLAQLGNKNIGFGPVGSAQYVGMTAYMDQIYGINESSLAANGAIAMYPTNSEVTTMLQDGQIDVAFFTGTYPASTFKELEFSPGLKLINFNEAAADEFIANNPNWTKWTIPAGSYAGQDEDVTTISSFALLVCQNSLDEEMVYQMTKTMWENVETIYDSSSDAKAFMNIETALVVEGKVPLHPGAERYYKEIGIL